MKTKTKMPKAMYGKTMMKKGGVKKMQKGGTKKSLSKAQLGENFQGPVTKKTNELVNKEYKEYTGPRVYDQDVKDADELKRLRENYDRIPKEKKGGAVKKYQDGGTLPKKPKPFSTKSSKIGLGILSSAIAGITGKVIGDAVKARKAKKAEEEKLKKEKETQSKSTEMKKGGAIKKMQKGGVKKSLPKAQYGVAGIGEAVNKAVKGVKASSGPARRAAIADKNTTFPWKSPTGVVYPDRKSLEAGSPSSKLTLEAYGIKKKGGAVRKMQTGGTAMKAAKSSGASAAKAIKASSGPTRRAAIADKNTTFPWSSPTGVVYPDRKSLEAGTPSSKLTIENLKKMGKMMTGGMVNPNAKVSKQTVAGSKGVMSGVNPKASASNAASSKGSGRANTPPSQATPAAKRGGAVKKMQRGGTPGYPGIPSPTKKIESSPRYSKSVYDSQGRIKSQKQMSKKMQKGGMIKRK